MLSRRHLLAAAPALPIAATTLSVADPVQAQTEIDTHDAKTSITITEAEIFKLRFDRKTPKTWNAIKSSGGTYPTATFLRVKTDAGIEGVVQTKGSSDDILKFCRKIENLNLLNIEEAWNHIYFDNRKPVAKGKEIHAIGSVDLALWDILGKAMGQPVHRLLGTYRTEVPAYAAGGYYAEGKTTRDLVLEMEGYAREGFNVVKMKVGGLPAREDAERVRAVVKALGSDARVMIDANNGYPSAYEAIRFGRMVEDLDLYWFEEPVIPYDWAGNRECREELDIPITAGENEYTRWGALDLLSNRACDIMNMDTIKGGGISEIRKVAALCSAYHVPIAPHGYAHMNIHVFASLANALILETYPAKARDFNPALPQFEVRNGKIRVPMQPGLGMEPEQSLIDRYRVE